MFYLRSILSILILTSSSLSFAMADYTGRETDSPLIGKQAPDATLNKSDGSSAGIMDERDDKKAILFIWATWCPHCWEEIGTINDKIPTLERKDIKVILVDIGETNEEVKNYFQRRQMDLVSFVDQQGILQAPYQVMGVPTLVFIDEKGVIRSITHKLPADYEHYF